jgi:hypothetical protein
VDGVLVLEVMVLLDLSLGVDDAGLSGNVPAVCGEDTGGLAVVDADFVIVLEAVVILSANALAICAATSAQS